MPTDPGAEGEVADADRGQELVLDRLRPDVEQHRVGDLELADVDDRQRDRRPGRTTPAPASARGTASSNRWRARRRSARRAARRRRRRCARPSWRCGRQRPDTAEASARQLNEDLLELRLAHLHVADHDALRCSGAQQLGQALLGLVHRAPDPAVGLARTRAPPAPRRATAPSAGPAAARSRSPSRIWRFSSSGVPAGEDRPALMNAISSHSSSASRM